jgi:hypothetical protein
MNYAETKHFQRLCADRLTLLNHLHRILNHAIRTNQKSLAESCHRTLDSLQVKSMFISAPSVNHGV